MKLLRMFYVVVKLSESLLKGESEREAEKERERERERERESTS